MKKEGGNGTLGREKDKEILYVLRFSEKKVTRLAKMWSNGV